MYPQITKINMPSINNRMVPTMMVLELCLCLMTACHTTLVVSTRLYGTHSCHFGKQI